MTSTIAFTSAHWAPDQIANDRALEVARSVVGSSSRAVKHLRQYYATESNYAGRTFCDLEPNEPNAITPTDLLAVTTLSVDMHPHAIRTFMHAEAKLSAMLQTLSTDLRLETIDSAETVDLMAAFYDEVKRGLRRAGAETGNAWVTASKICARKRPNLFPVRDNVVLDLLCLPKNYPVDWPAFLALAADDELMHTLDHHAAEASERDDVDLDDSALRLRHLDVVLWMHAMNPEAGQLR